MLPDYHSPLSRRSGTLRSPAEERSLRVRILDGLHRPDVYRRMRAELGERAEVIGPLDLSRNPLVDYVTRLGRAYMTPPLVDDLDPTLAYLIGDLQARTTVERYAVGGGRPMPYRMAITSAEVLRYALGVGYGATLIGYSERSHRPYLEAVAPDVLEVVYASDDPLSPTVITHRRRRVPLDGGRAMDVEEVYDLSDYDAPSYRILHDGHDVTEAMLGATYSGDAYPWRYEDGRPYHRIVIMGDPRHPYRGQELVEGTLGVAVLWTHWTAGVRDAGWPQRSAIGLRLAQDSDAQTHQAGLPVGPESVVIWEYEDPARPGQLHQWGPGFDPEAIGRAIRQRELSLIESTGLPVSYEATGGDPTEQERLALERAIAATYPMCRGHDGLVLRRVAATVNRATDLYDLDRDPIPERAPGILYREEAEAALQPAEDTTDG